ncbi:hypothetical protein B296_00025161 [Ensete ventricosum]|uniref:Uncharacterized protein n=1 Tax=Ensete ventricosum TaxID=4639 RepID=A0A427ATT5_ENSVE|nr:hypothetical protein B296_00025161 [Ensete ventricosum]
MILALASHKRFDSNILISPLQHLGDRHGRTLIRATIICFKCQEPKVLWDRLILDLWDEGRSTRGAFPKFLFQPDELLLDLVDSLVY